AGCPDNGFDRFVEGKAQNASSEAPRPAQHSKAHIPGEAEQAHRLPPRPAHRLDHKIVDAKDQRTDKKIPRLCQSIGAWFEVIVANNPAALRFWLRFVHAYLGELVCQKLYQKAI